MRCLAVWVMVLWCIWPFYGLAFLGVGSGNWFAVFSCLWLWYDFGWGFCFGVGGGSAGCLFGWLVVRFLTDLFSGFGGDYFGCWFWWCV